MIILHSQAPNYGDIKLEIHDGNNVIERNSFLINPAHRIYFLKVNQIPDNGQLRFYFDRRHRAFTSKGVLIIGNNFNFKWAGPNLLIDDDSHHQVRKASTSRFRALFEGFGQSAYFKIDTKPGNFYILVLLVFTFICAVLVLLTAMLINKALVKYELLSRHKLKLLVIVFLAITFLINSPAKGLII